MGKDIQLRDLDKNDLPAISAIHMAAFSDAALTKLGADVVRRYYEWQLLGPHEVYTCGAFIDGKCVGFYLGGAFRGATSGFLQQNRKFLVKRVLTHPWLLTNPLIRTRVKFSLNTLRRSAKPRSQESQPEKKGKQFSILSIAVDPQCQGLGIGKLLMKEAEAAARQHDFQELSLYVKTDNHQAVGFYESIHWKKFLKKGKWIGNMTKSLEF
jgi:ribosomal protein S18 acetylase RimI-like enzyme